MKTEDRKVELTAKDNKYNFCLSGKSYVKDSKGRLVHAGGKRMLMFTLSQPEAEMVYELLKKKLKNKKGDER